MKLSAIVLTRDEERNIADCLTSLSWADEMLVVDSGILSGITEISQMEQLEVIKYQ